MLKISKEDCERYFKEGDSFQEFWERVGQAGFVYGDEPLSLDSVQLFSRIYKYFRMKAFHKGIKLITPSNKQWSTLVAVCEDAEVFCKEFEITDIREGFKEYLTIAKELGYLNLRTLKYKGEDIANYRALSIEIDNDSGPVYTEALAQAYLLESLHRYGHSVSLGDPITYSHMVRASKLGRSLGMSPTLFIHSVFDLWAWLGSVIEPSKLYSDYVKTHIGQVQIHKPVTVTLKLGKGRDRYGED